jgi:hypothetical protein
MPPNGDDAGADAETHDRVVDDGIGESSSSLAATTLDALPYHPQLWLAQHALDEGVTIANPLLDFLLRVYGRIYGSPQTIRCRLESGKQIRIRELLANHR